MEESKDKIPIPIIGEKSTQPIVRNLILEKIRRYGSVTSVKNQTKEVNLRAGAHDIKIATMQTIE